MRPFLLTTVAALAMSAAVAQPPAAPDAAPLPPPVSETTKSIQGFWKCQSIQFDGTEQMTEPAERDALTLVVKGSEYRMFMVSDAAKDLHVRLFTAHIVFDEAAKTFTNTVVNGREKGKKVHGIYEIKDGVFKTCYGPAERPRPTTFETTQGSGLFAETWKIEAAKTPAAGQTAGGK